MDAPLPSFTARVVPGDGRGKRIGTPTLNLALEDVPAGLSDGVYACTVEIDAEIRGGAMHLGPRPAFRAGRACEVHVLDAELATAPDRLSVRPVKRLRDVLDFPSPEALRAQIASDIDAVRATLASA